MTDSLVPAEFERLVVPRRQEMYPLPAIHFFGVSSGTYPAAPLNSVSGLELPRI